MNKSKSLDLKNDLIFKAIGDATRRAILKMAYESPGINVNQVSEPFKISRIAIIRHIKVLEESGLLVSEREGTNKKLFFENKPVEIIQDFLDGFS